MSEPTLQETINEVQRNRAEREQLVKEGVLVPLTPAVTTAIDFIWGSFAREENLRHWKETEDQEAYIGQIVAEWAEMDPAAEPLTQEGVRSALNLCWHWQFAP